MISKITEIMLSKKEDFVRVCQLGLIFTNHRILSYYLNRCDYRQTVDIIENLTNIIKGELAVYEWGAGGKKYFRATSAKTEIEDLFFNFHESEVETSLVLDIMKHRLRVMESYTKEELFSIIIRSFEEIKKSPKEYALKSLNNKYGVFNKITKTDTILTLEDRDLSLNSQQFGAELYFNKMFIKEC